MSDRPEYELYPLWHQNLPKAKKAHLDRAVLTLAEGGYRVIDGTEIEALGRGFGMPEGELTATLKHLAFLVPEDEEHPGAGRWLLTPSGVRTAKASGRNPAPPVAVPAAAPPAATPRRAAPPGKGHNREDLTGLKFGRLTVAALTPERQCASAVWLCRCDCRAECRVSARDLKRGSKVCCGCFRPRRKRKGEVANV